MTASATVWPEASRTGLDLLSEILSAPRSSASHDLWDLLYRAYPAAAKTLARPSGVLRTSAQPRADLDARNLERLELAWPWHAAAILADLGRSLGNSPHTLRALATGAPNPVHGAERAALCATVSRRLLILGCEPNEVAVRAVTYAAVDAIRDALANLT